MIQLFLTGGTIDKHYRQDNGELDFAETNLHDMLALGRNQSAITIEQLMLKDSLDMDKFDRAHIADSCSRCIANKILITHGTDTMVETAQFIATMHPQLLTEKTIVLFGAMIPYSVNNSDAMFNLGFAIGALNMQTPGIYIAMNGLVFPYDAVQKNREKMIFEAI